MDPGEANKLPIFFVPCDKLIKYTVNTKKKNLNVLFSEVVLRKSASSEVWVLQCLIF